MISWLRNLFSQKSPPIINMRKEKRLKINQYCTQIGIPEKGKELLYNLHLIRKDNFNDYTLVTQAWHESAGFMRVIGRWNFWGIKKPRNWTGRTLKIKTHEYIKGKKQKLNDYFIDFSTIQEAIEWWQGLIRRLYKDAYQNRNNPTIFFEKLTDRTPDYPGDPDFRYATDPEYAQNLTLLYRQLVKNSFLTRLLQIT